MKDFYYCGQELDIFSNAVHWKKYFNSILLPDIGNTVAEVGAGIGATTAILCDGQKKSWLCIEPDTILRKIIDEKIKKGLLPTCCKASQTFITNLEDEQKFSTILYIDVLEHIDDDKNELINASKHLVKGGTLIVLSPAYQFLYSEFDRAIGHYRRYNHCDLLALTPNGCSVKRIHYLDSVGALTSLANRFLLKQAQPSLRQIQFWDKFLLPISIILDKVIKYRFGRSVVIVWKMEQNDRPHLPDHKTDSIRRGDY
jgi:hypothetical protein